MGHKIIFLFLLISAANPFKLRAQKNPVLYGGMELFRHTDFENNSFGNFSLGSQLYHWKFFAPEIGFSHYGGTFRERGISHKPGIYTITPGLFNMNFNANVITFTPKIKVGKDDAFLSFSPTYHRGTAKAIGRYYVLENRRYVLEEGQKERVPVAFWSFSLGVEGFAIQEEKYWFTIFLTYTEVDANAPISRLNFTDYSIHTSDISTSTIGLGIRFYINPFPVKGN